MSSYAARAPRAISLPRLRIKRPRWPRGSRFWLFLAALNVVFFVLNFIEGDWEFFVGAAWNVFWGAIAAWMYWRSRNDGPGAA